VPQDTLITVDHVSRFYGDTCVVKDINLEVGRGEVIGFLGPNGAGKSTTMQMISGNLAPSAGRIFINGTDILDDPKNAKAQLGYLSEQPPLYRELTVDEYLNHCARLNRIAKANVSSAMDNAKQRCGLTDVGHRLIGNLSKGFQQRVGIAQAIIHSPPVVILDEPTVGLDPIQIREIRDLIRELGGEHSVILSTHILPEVQATCDRVTIINKGELALTDSIEGLSQRMQATSLLLGMHRPPPAQALEVLEHVTDVEVLPENQIRVHFSPDHDPAETITKLAVDQNWGLWQLTPERHSLEQIFIDITCKEQAADVEQSSSGETVP